MSESLSGQETEFAAFIAFDWGDREHAWSMQEAVSSWRERGTLEHRPEAIEAWAEQWGVRFSGRPVAIAIEQARGAVIFALAKYAHVVLYPIHPGTSHAYRQAIFPSGGKDDPKDADLLLDLLTGHRERLRALEMDTEPTRLLQQLVEKRRQLVDLRTAHTNRITAMLKVYFPQVLDWFDDLGSALVGDFLDRWATLESVQKERAEVLRAFFRQHHCRSEQRIQQRLEQILSARPLTEDAAVIQPAVLMVQALLAAVAALQKGIAAVDREIEKAAAAHPDTFIFASFPAAGKAMCPRLVAAFGSRRERYSHAGQIQSFSGIAPVISRSGSSHHWIHFRWACPKFLRQTFHEYAAGTIARCAWARAFYQQQRARGKSREAAIRSLAFKWIRILFHCWQHRICYDEAVLLRSRGAAPTAPAAEVSRPPIATAAAADAVEFEFKKVLGFVKFAAANS